MHQHDYLLAATLQAAVASLELNVESEQHATMMEKKRLAELAHERDVLNKLRTQVCPTVALTCPASRPQAPAGCKVAAHDLACGCFRTASSPELPLVCVLQADSATQKQQDLVRMTENSKRTLEQEVASYRWAAVPQPNRWRKAARTANQTMLHLQLSSA